ncbi:hypothetical protein FJR38_26275 [Anabaena sp. UHCC 0253]|uniref:hypothetical protein n=1 Tax=Anabaena sp. UHCC 0253 TaxID=2590019 RepID=UPI001446E116|nr:hypothetical protein [Anabaena sp. UHCC 0253]MTJ55913.1 hypothetical protein [Anabaena sp. UHCC 0253]
MSVFQESGLQITLPVGENFRFQDCPSYQNLNGQNLSEMDFGWWDAGKNTLWLLEVKDYSHLTPLERLPDHLLDKLINKATDSLLILASVWFGSLRGKQICGDLPISCQSFPIQPKNIRLVFIIKVTDANIKLQLSPLKTRLRTKLLGRLSLFDISGVTLADHETAIQNGLPIEII